MRERSARRPAGALLVRARRLCRGIRVIHQDAPLVPGFDTVENCFLGRPYPRRLGRIDRRAMRAAVAAVAVAVAPGLDLAVPVMFLPPAERQFVRLLRALSDRGRLLILDEPTAALPAEDAARFFEALRRTRERGTAIVLVSHRLDEIAGFCERAVVLRDGRVAAAFGPGEVTPPALIATMGGGAAPAAHVATVAPDAPVVLAVEGLAAGELVRPASLAARAGEVVALYGLAGAGRSSLLDAVWGAIPARRHDAARARPTPRSPREAVRAGISYAGRPPPLGPLDQSLVFNKTPAALSTYRRLRHLPVPDPRAERRDFLVAAGRV